MRFVLYITSNSIEIMKKLFIIPCLSVALLGQSCAQSHSTASVPENVQQAFQSKFPQAKKVQWEMENETEWEAEFVMNHQEYSANFSVQGTWLETEWEIKEDEVPSEVLAALTREFGSYEIEEAERVESPEGKGYELEIEANGEEFEVVIDQAGNLTKKVTEDEED